MLKNKTALITGASRGIGRAIALLYAEQGCDIGASLFYPRGEYLTKAGIVIDCEKPEIGAVNAFVIAACAVVVTDENDLIMREVVFLAP